MSKSSDPHSNRAARVQAYFERMGNQVEDAWHRANYEDAALPALAERSLLDNLNADDIQLPDLMHWALTQRSLGLQPNANSEFGQPPLTVYSGRRFYIEALCWFDSTTAIHDHKFVGAFGVLQGSSVHSTYRFKQRHRYSHRLLLGDAIFEKAEILRRGQVRQILGGEDFIHALYHLDHPSISLVIRTPSTPAVEEQRIYLPPHIAKIPTDGHVWNKRASDYVGSAITMRDRGLIDELVRIAVRNADDIGAFNILHALTLRGALATGTVTADGQVSEAAALTEFTEHRAAEHALEVAIEAIKEKFGSAAEEMIISCEENTRAQELAAARANVTNKDLRFFLALLMNVPNRERLLEIVRESYPSKDPIEQVLAWLAELTNASAPMAHYAIEGDAFVLLESLIRRLPAEEAIARLEKHHGRSIDASETSDVRDALEVLRTFPLVRPLL